MAQFIPFPTLKSSIPVPIQGVPPPPSSLQNLHRTSFSQSIYREKTCSFFGGSFSYILLCFFSLSHYLLRFRHNQLPSY
ncbi:hypothetical protein CPB83DRAFT_18186 [Crepidotus variabilis]|uniref:Uncharacterized protein n=1 Tax=Crepidotus variabilis TaxID=179855 RepID=A0A9P6JVK0_9AGAR|nr:hypothetical protein CPB83DRAFT_18186 [Crepidotus variabilis]